MQSREQKNWSTAGEGELGRVIIITTKGSHPETPRKVLPGAQPTEQWVKKPHGPPIRSMNGSLPNAFWKTLDPFPVAKLGLTCWDSQCGDLRELQRPMEHWDSIYKNAVQAQIHRRDSIVI